jgi:hypothetical protein
MSTDKMFILLLVVLLPLTGCLDLIAPADADADADDHSHSVNNPPVIYGELTFTDYYDYDTSTLHEDVLVFRGTVFDIGGGHTYFGVDWNFDGVIDSRIYVATSLYDSLYVLTDNTSWMQPTVWNPSGHLADAEYCYQWVQLIAVDDEGAMQINPYRAIFKIDGETDQCTFERTNG